MSSLIQIVPSLPPAVGGVGDYALALEREWVGRWTVDGGSHPVGQTAGLASDLSSGPASIPQTRPIGDRAYNEPASQRLEAKPPRPLDFSTPRLRLGPGHTVTWIVAGGGVASRAAFPDARILDAAELGWERALAEAGAGTVLVHYTQYGFCSAGIPEKLVRALLRWRTAGGGLRLTVFFHETWLRGPWWRRRGLVAPLARRVAGRLAAGADAWATNCERHAAELTSLAGRGPAAVLPVPSNIVPPPGCVFRDRDAVPGRLRLVVFGLPETRLRAVVAHAGLLRFLAARDRLEEVVLLGGGTADDRFARQADGLLAGAGLAAKIRRTGPVGPEAISRELAAADLGLCAYAVDACGKSGTLAALLAHGCPAAFAGHDGGGIGWNLARTGDAEPAEWGAFLDPARRASRHAAARAYAVDRLAWPAHARAVHELTESCRPDR